MLLANIAVRAALKFAQDDYFYLSSVFDSITKTPGQNSSFSPFLPYFESPTWARAFPIETKLVLKSGPQFSKVAFTRNCEHHFELPKKQFCWPSSGVYVQWFRSCGVTVYWLCVSKFSPVFFPSKSWCLFNLRTESHHVVIGLWGFTVDHLVVAVNWR